MTQKDKTGREGRPGTKPARTPTLAGAMALTAVIAAFLATFAAKADPYNLQTLIDSNGSITVGDKRFSGFVCSITSHTGFAAPNACKQINVIAIDNDPLGLSFHSSFVTVGAVFKDVLLGYTVDVFDSSQQIHGIDLAFNGEIFGQAVTQVTETAFAADNSPAGQTQVINTQSGSILRNSFALNDGYSSLTVRKDVLLGGYVNTATATISFIDQRFEQNGLRPVPEPGALATVGAGLLGFGLLRWQRRRVTLAPSPGRGRHGA